MQLIEKLFGAKCVECRQKIKGEKFLAPSTGWLCQICHSKLEEERKQKIEGRKRKEEEIKRQQQEQKLREEEQKRKKEEEVKRRRQEQVLTPFQKKALKQKAKEIERQNEEQRLKWKTEQQRYMQEYRQRDLERTTALRVLRNGTKEEKLAVLSKLSDSSGDPESQVLLAIIDLLGADGDEVREEAMKLLLATSSMPSTAWKIGL